MACFNKCKKEDRRPCKRRKCCEPKKECQEKPRCGCQNNSNCYKEINCYCICEKPEKVYYIPLGNGYFIDPECYEIFYKCDCCKYDCCRCDCCRCEKVCYKECCCRNRY